MTDEPLQAGAAAPQDPAAPGEREQVLVGDSSPSIRRALARVLESDYAVIEAAEAEGVWARLVEAREVRLALLDVAVALGSGGLMERVRSARDPAIARLPVILVADSRVGESEKQDALRRGVNEFLITPFSTAEVRARVRAVLDAGRAQGRYQHGTRYTGLELASDPRPDGAGQSYFVERLTQELSFAQRHHSELTVMRLAVDGFEAMAQGLGESLTAGVLRLVGAHLRQSVRREDTVAHFGDGQYGILLPATGELPARHLAERLLEGVRRLSLHKGESRLQLTASAGLYAPVGGFDQGAKAAMGLASRRLAQALRSGRGRIVGAEGYRPEPARSAGPLGVDQALALLAASEVAPVESQLRPLLHRLRPLLELAEQRLGLGLGPALARLRREALPADPTQVEQPGDKAGSAAPKAEGPPAGARAVPRPGSKAR